MSSIRFQLTLVVTLITVSSESLSASPGRDSGLTPDRVVILTIANRRAVDAIGDCQRPLDAQDEWN